MKSWISRVAVVIGATVAALAGPGAAQADPVLDWFVTARNAINVGVPAPMAWFPFTGWNKSFFGDLHIQGTEGVQFYTQQKMTLTRWFKNAGESTADPIWKTKKGGS